MPSFTGNFLPVSGQINQPSTKYTSNNTLYRFAITVSSKLSSVSLLDTSISSGISGKADISLFPQCGLSSCTALSNAG